jgi:glycosyltransferase involved in cell wall biosynthesis
MVGTPAGSSRQSPNRLPPHDRWNVYDAGEFKHLRVGCFKAEGTDPTWQVCHGQATRENAMTGYKVVMLVENSSVPSDRRVWMEALTLAEAGYKVSVICVRRVSPKFYERLNGVAIYRYPLPSLRGFGGHLLEYAIALPVTFILTWVVLFREGFDVIHAANPPDFLYLIGRVFKLFGKRFLFDHHDLVPETCLTRWSGVKLRLTLWIATKAERATFRTADVVISSNAFYRRLAIERGHMEPGRVFVVRSAIRTTEFRKGERRPELRRGKPHLVCYVGEIGPDDGLDKLLLAIRHVVITCHREDVQFVIVGTGDLFRQIVRMSDKLGLADAVHFTGWISDDKQISDYLATADLCVVPDPKNPANDVGSMNKLVEYMALGKPVVAFDLQEVRDTAREAAVYVRSNDPSDFGDRIIGLLDSPQDRKEMGEQGIKRFNEVLAWEHQLVSLLEAYDRLQRLR